MKAVHVAIILADINGKKKWIAQVNGVTVYEGAYFRRLFRELIRPVETQFIPVDAIPGTTPEGMEEPAQRTLPIQE